MESPETPDPRARTARKALIALAVLASLIRLGAAAATLGLATPPASGSDELEYDTYAWNLAQGRGYRGCSSDVSDQDHLTAYRAPGPSLYYAALYRAFGHHYPIALASNAALAGLTVLLVFGIARRCAGEAAGWLAATAFAAYPISIYYGLTLNSEVFAAWLVALFVWCGLGVAGPRGGAWSLGAGLALGALLLSKPGFLFALPLLPFWAWLVCGRRLDRWRRILVIPLAAGLVLAPWVARNWVVMHRFIPFSTAGGQLLLCGNNRYVIGDPMLYGYSVMDTSLPEYAPTLRGVDDEARRDDAAKRFALDWLLANPDKWFYLAQGKLLRLWSPQYAGTRFGGFRVAAMTYYGLILAAFAAALVPVSARLIRGRHPASLMLCLIAGTVAMALVFHGQHRYRFPIDGLCMVIAASGLAGLMDARPSLGATGRWAVARRRPLAASAVAAVALVACWAYDQHRMERYRDRECRARLAAIARALDAFRADRGRPPTSLGELVPAYLPNIDALHCPKHSLGWQDYLLMTRTDARGADGFISYRLDGGPGAARVVEDQARHFGRRNAAVAGGPARVAAGPMGTGAGYDE